MELADNLSDYGSTLLELGKTSKKQGKGFWRFNKSFLSDPEFLEITNSLIRDTIKEYSVDDFNNVDVDDSILKSDLFYPSTWLNSRKGKGQYNSIFSKKRKQLSVVSSLNTEIKDLEEIVNNSENTVPGVRGKIKDLKDRLEIEVERKDTERANLA